MALHSARRRPIGTAWRIIRPEYYLLTLLLSHPQCRQLLVLAPLGADEILREQPDVASVFCEFEVSRIWNCLGAAADGLCERSLSVRLRQAADDDVPVGRFDDEASH
jgi:hypothetical protein